MTIQAEQQLEQDYVEAPEEILQKNKKQPFSTKMTLCEMCYQPALAVTIQMVDELLPLCPLCTQYLEQIPDGLLKESFKQRLIGNVI